MLSLPCKNHLTYLLYLLTFNENNVKRILAIFGNEHLHFFSPDILNGAHRVLVWVSQSEMDPRFISHDLLNQNKRIWLQVNTWFLKSHLLWFVMYFCKKTECIEWPCNNTTKILCLRWCITLILIIAANQRKENKHNYMQICETKLCHLI